ncbi:hypothetical protein ACFLWU_01775 [Chloroflexota bacterium]
MTEKKYSKHVTPAPISIPVHDGYTRNALYAHKGELNAGCTMGFHIITETFEEGPPHKHNAHQILAFLGSDLEDINNFDAEIEVALGDECEIQTITSPSVVSIPPGLSHCPLRFKRLGKPVIFLEVTFESSYERVLEPTEDGSAPIEVYTRRI